MRVLMRGALLRALTRCGAKEARRAKTSMRPKA